MVCRAVLFFITYLGLIAGVGAAETPNIVVILADDMGIGDVSCLNKESKIPTPNIDRLAARGIAFTDAHSGSALCTPTRYGILTGQYSWRTRLKRGVTWGFSPHLIDPQRMTVASLLKANGYNTACIGKWHLGMDMSTKSGEAIGADGANPGVREFIADIDYRKPIQNGPNAVGFDYFFGISASLDMHPYIYIENERFVGECTTEKDFTFRKTISGPAEPDFEDIDVMPELTRRTVDYIESQSKDEPFFVYMPLTAPHIPVSPSKPFQGRNELGPYGDFVMEVDGTVGRVLNALERKGFSDNTLVIFTADNGAAHYVGAAEMIEQGHYPSYLYRGYKADIYEGGHRVPFVAQWPGKIESGAVSDEIICLTDLLATCAAIVGTKIPADAGEDSYNVLPALLGETTKGPIREATVHHSMRGTFAIRQGKWKLVLDSASGGYATLSSTPDPDFPPVQLYDLESDIAESKNVYREYGHVVERLTALLNDYKMSGRSAPLIR